MKVIDIYKNLETTKPAIIKFDLIKKCKELGMRDIDIEKSINELKKEGVIYEAMEGILRRLT